MAKTRITYKQYGAEGKEIEQPQKEIITTGNSPFFNTPFAVSLIGTEKNPGLLKTHSHFHAARLAEVEAATQDNMTHFLREAESEEGGKNPDIGPLLFPDTKKDNINELERKAKALHEALLKAAEWAAAKADAEVYRFLTSVGEYAESVIQESPWEDAIPSELYRLTVLSKGNPHDFLKIEKDKKQLAFINEYVAELNKTKQECPKKVEINPDGTLSLEGKKFAEKIQAVHTKFLDRSINQKIEEIKIIQVERNKSIFGRIINFFNFIQKYKLANLQKLKNSKAVEVISVLNEVSKGSAASQEKYDHSAKLIEAKKLFDNFNKEEFINQPSKTSLLTVAKLRDAIKLLMNAPANKSYLQEFIVQAQTKAIKKIKDVYFNEENVNDLTVLFTFFDKEATQGCQEFLNASDEIVKALEERLANFLDADKAINFINSMLQAKASNVSDKVSALLSNRLEQYQSWKAISGFRAKIYNEGLSERDVEAFYTHALTLTNNGTKSMVSMVEGVVTPLKHKILLILSKTNSLPSEKELVKRYLTLFQSEKLAIPDQHEDLKFFIDARNEIKEAVLAKLDKADNLDDFNATLANLQALWPEPIDSKYIEIHNDGDLPIFIPDNQRLDKLTHVSFDSKVMNYAVGVGGVSIDPNKSRVFWCSPVVQDKAFQQAITDKAKSLMLDRTIDKIEGFSPRIKFLKEKDRGLLATIWTLITGNDTTELTPENLQKYVTDLVDEYVEALFQQRLNGYGDERDWINRRVVQDVEEVAQALNANLYNLIHEAEQQKFSKTMGLPWKPVDINHLLLQWSFITTFRANFACSSIEKIYKNTGMNIVCKIEEFSKNDADFLHKFLGKMNKEQLDALNATFVDMPSVSQAGDVYSLDLIGDQQSASQEGQNVLRKSMLLSAVSELVKQELVLFLNDEPVDVNLFREHMAFVCQQLPQLHTKAKQLNDSKAAVKVREDITNAMRALLENTDHEKEQGLTKLVEHLVQLTILIGDEDRLKAFCAKYEFDINDLRKREASLFKIATDIPSAKGRNVKLCDIFDKIDDGLINIVDVYIKKEAQAKPALLLSDMKYRYAKLHKQYEKINTAKNPFDLVEFIQGLTDSVVNQLPENLIKFCRQIQYAFADRFTLGMGQILGDNLNTTERKEEKLKALKSTEFYDLVCLVFKNEEDRENIFRITRTKYPLPSMKERVAVEIATFKTAVDDSRCASFKDNGFESVISDSVSSLAPKSPKIPKSPRQMHSLFSDTSADKMDALNKNFTERLLRGPGTSSGC